MHKWISIKHSKLQYRVTIWGTTFYIRSPWNRPLEALGMRAALPAPSCPHCLKWELRVQNCFFTALHTSTYELAVENKKQLCQATVETDLMELDLRIQKPVVILLRLREVKEFAQGPKAQDFNYLSPAINWNIRLFRQQVLSSSYDTAPLPFPASVTVPPQGSLNTQSMLLPQDCF